MGADLPNAGRIMGVGPIDSRDSPHGDSRRCCRRSADDRNGNRRIASRVTRRM